MESHPRGGDDWPPLTDADRRGIDEIRRQLDRELGPLGDAGDPPARALAEPAAARAAPPSRRAVMIAAVIIAAVAGAALGSALTVILLVPPSGAPAPAPVTEPDGPSLPPREGRTAAPEAGTVAAALDPPGVRAPRAGYRGSAA